MSERVMKLLENFSPDVEIYSIDEAFLKLPASDDYQKVGCDIKNYMIHFFWEYYFQLNRGGIYEYIYQN